MQQFDIPIIHQSYEFYRTLHELHKSIPKAERYSLWQRCEGAALDILKGLLKVSYLTPDKRADALILISADLDMLRVFLRLAFDVKILDKKKYVAIQQALDEIGRMLGGWLKSLRVKS